MSAYSDAQLELLLADVESDLVERKEALKGDSLHALARALLARVGLAQSSA